MVGAGQLTHVRTLAAEPAGHVWAVGLASRGLSVHTTVARFDGSRWSSPQPSAPRSRGTVVADSHRRGPAAARSRTAPIRRSGLAQASRHPAWRPGQFAPARGPGHLTLRSRVVAGRGLPGEAGVGPVAQGRRPRVARSGPDGLHGRGCACCRFHGPASPRGGPPDSACGSIEDSRLGEPPVRLVALSFDEAWAISARGSEPDAILRFSDGGWQEMAPGVNPIGLAVGTDGGVWVSTVEGLVRFSGGQWEAIDAGPQAGSLLAGPDGAVWVPQPTSHNGCRSDGGASGAHQDFRQLALVQPEGQRTTLRLPVGDRPVTSIVAGADGRVWTTTCRGGVEDHGPTAPTLMRVGRDVVAGPVSGPEHHRNRRRSARRVLGLVDP